MKRKFAVYFLADLIFTHTHSDKSHSVIVGKLPFVTETPRYLDSTEINTINKLEVPGIYSRNVTNVDHINWPMDLTI